MEDISSLKVLELSEALRETNEKIQVTKKRGIKRKSIGNEEARKRAKRKDEKSDTQLKKLLTDFKSEFSRTIVETNDKSESTIQQSIISAIDRYTQHLEASEKQAKILKKPKRTQYRIYS